jgi:hypothetical protein
MASCLLFIFKMCLCLKYNYRCLRAANYSEHQQPQLQIHQMPPQHPSTTFLHRICLKAETFKVPRALLTSCLTCSTWLLEHFWACSRHYSFGSAHVSESKWWFSDESLFKDGTTRPIKKIQILSSTWREISQQCCTTQIVTRKMKNLKKTSHDSFNKSDHKIF